MNTSSALPRLSLVILILTLLNASKGLPSSRRYGYDDEDNFNRRSAGYKTGFGSGLSDHATWCPLRRREPFRSPQRLSPMRQDDNYDSDDDRDFTRYPRSHRVNTNSRQSNNFNDVDISEINDGVNVGGVLWPRRSSTPLDVENRSMQSGGCPHNKAAAFAKDATAAAASAATAAAMAAQAAAKAAAAAACNPDEVSGKEDLSESDESEEVNQDVPREGVLEYSNNVRESHYVTDKFSESDTNVDTTDDTKDEETEALNEDSDTDNVLDSRKEPSAEPEIKHSLSEKTMENNLAIKPQG